MKEIIGMIELVEKTAEARKDIPVPRIFIKEALKKIESGEFKVSRYPGGAPSLKDVYDVAFSLMPRPHLNHLTKKRDFELFAQSLLF